jgi:hypothetical protein
MCIREYSKRTSEGLEGKPHNVTDASNRKGMSRIAIAFTVSEGSSRYGRRNPITPDQTGQPGISLLFILSDALRSLPLRVERHVERGRAIGW